MENIQKGEITPKNALEVLENYEELQYSEYCEFCVNDKYTQIPLNHEIKCNILGILTDSRGGGSSFLLIDLDTEISEVNAFVCPIQKIPDNYLPSEKSFFKESQYEKYALILSNELQKTIF